MTMKIEVNIDGKTFEVEPGKMIIEVADAAGIVIPRFCYHKKLSVAANCRMCLVEVEKSRKPLPACATPVTSGMVVRTRSPMALESQKAVMEFLLLNHPLDCPICDQGGECELQDVSLEYGSSDSRYDQTKRSVKDKDLGPLVETEMTRCIHCTRCVRFGREIAGISELGSMGRGEHTEISTYVEKSLTSELSGNIIDLCPVGALTNKPFRYRARAWELTQSPSVSPHDGVGSNLHIHSRRSQVMRVVPKENETINETWISDRDRFSCEGLYHEDRVLSPMIKRNGNWETVDWQTALQTAVDSLKAVIEKHNVDAIGAITTPNATLEELFLFQKLMRSVGCHNIDHRLEQSDFQHQQAMATYPTLPISIEAIEQQSLILVVGGNPQQEQPMIHHRVRKAYDNGATLLAVNPFDFQFNVPFKETLLVENPRLPHVLGGIAHVIGTRKGSFGNAKELLENIVPTEDETRMAEELLQGKAPLILLGALAQNHPQGGLIHGLCHWIASALEGHCGLLTTGANAAGAWLVGAVPHRGPTGLNLNKPALDIRRMWETQLPAYVLLNVEPEYDCAQPQMAKKALEAAECVVCLSTYKTKAMESYAHVILPVAAFTETPGTFINMMGTWQSFAAAVHPQGDAKPAWKVLRVLGNLFSLDGFQYTTHSEVTDELRALTAHHELVQDAGPWRYPKNLPSLSEGIQCFSYWPMYRSDPLVRRSEPLQKTPLSESPRVMMSSELGASLQLKGGEKVQISQGKEASMVLPVEIRHGLVGKTVAIPGGFLESSHLKESCGVIEIKAAT